LDPLEAPVASPFVQLRFFTLRVLLKLRPLLQLLCPPFVSVFEPFLSGHSSDQWQLRQQLAVLGHDGSRPQTRGGTDARQEGVYLFQS